MDRHWKVEALPSTVAALVRILVRSLGKVKAALAFHVTPQRSRLENLPLANRSASVPVLIKYRRISAPLQEGIG
jgi:hypothetical protein